MWTIGVNYYKKRTKQEIQTTSYIHIALNRQLSMVTPDNLSAILQSLKSNTLTAIDIETLAHFLDDVILQTVTQSGKYNVNLGQASSTQIGDRYGPSVEEIRAIIQELRKLEPQSSATESKQSEQVLDNDPLEILTIKFQIVEHINSRLAAIDELQKAGQLSSSQQIEFHKLKGKVLSVKQINDELDDISSSVTQMLQEAVKTLAGKLRELDRSQGDSLLEASSHFCLKQQIELLEQFHSELRQGKVVAYWLKSQQFARHLGEFALDAYPEIKQTTSPQRLEAFYFSLEQFLERLEHCLTWGRTNNLDQVNTPVILNDKVYTIAFEHLKTLIPDHLPEDGIKQLTEYIDYLVKSLPDYPHFPIE